MASSSHPHLPRLLHPLLPFLVLSMLLPRISCDDTKESAILQCERFIVNGEEGEIVDGESVINEVNNAITFLRNSSSPGNQVSLKTIHGLAWCRADFSPTFCSSCLNVAAEDIKKRCAVNVVAARLLFYDICYIRIDVNNFLGKSDTKFGRVWFHTAFEIAGVHKVAYWQSVSGLLVRMKQKMERESTKFEKMDSFFGLEELKINGMAQCSHDLDTVVCIQCLHQAMIVMKKRCVYHTHCEAIYGSCFLKYETKQIKQ